MASSLGAALYYGRQKGWPIIPIWPVDIVGEEVRCRCGDKNCDNQGKHPIASINGREIAPKGILNATTVEETIRRWWSLVPPDANIGARGEKFFALDVDEEEAYQQLIEGFGALPDTIESVSGSGGRHILFRQPLGNPLGNTQGELPRGIHVRGKYGYIILPPSSHKSGRRYEWELSSHPRDVELADPPQWLVDLIRAGENDKIDVDIKDVQVPHLATLEISKITRGRILSGPGPDDDRSELDMQVACALIEASCTPSEIAAIFRKYPIGTSGKYADRGEDYLYRTISSAMSWTSPKVPKKHIPSLVQPDTFLTPEEAMYEEKALNLAYMQGWQDALARNVGVLPALWPEYVGLSKESVSFYSVGLQMDYKIDEGENEYPALVVPYHDMGTVTTLDYSLAKVPDGTPPRVWQSENGIQYFDSERFRSAPITGKVLVTEDFDTAMYVYFTDKWGTDFMDYAVLGQPRSRLADGQRASNARLQALALLLADSEQIWLAWPASRLAEAKVLAKMLDRGWERVKWVSLPFGLRDMIKEYGLKPEQLQRGINISAPVLSR